MCQGRRATEKGRNKNREREKESEIEIKRQKGGESVSILLAKCRENS